MSDSNSDYEYNSDEEMDIYDDNIITEAASNKCNKNNLLSLYPEQSQWINQISKLEKNVSDNWIINISEDNCLNIHLQLFKKNI